MRDGGQELMELWAQELGRWPSQGTFYSRRPHSEWWAPACGGQSPWEAGARWGSSWGETRAGGAHLEGIPPPDSRGLQCRQEAERRLHSHG